MELISKFSNYTIYDNMIECRKFDGSYGSNEVFEILEKYYVKYGVFGFSIIGVYVNESDLINNVTKVDGGYVLKRREVKYFGMRNHVLPIRLVIEILKENLNIERKELLLNKELPYRQADIIVYKDLNELKDEENYVINYVSSCFDRKQSTDVGFDCVSGVSKKMNPNEFLIYFGSDKMKKLKKMYITNYTDTDIGRLVSSLKPDLRDKVNKKLSNKEIYNFFINLLNDYSTNGQFKNFKYKVNDGAFLISFDLDSKVRLVVGTNFMYKEKISSSRVLDLDITSKEITLNDSNLLNRVLIYNLSTNNSVEEAVKILESYNLYLFNFIASLIDGRRNPLKLVKK